MSAVRSRVLPAALGMSLIAACVAVAPAPAQARHGAPERCATASTGHKNQQKPKHGKHRPSPYLCATPGQLLEVRIGEVAATQPSLGYDQIYYKLGRYTLGKDAINNTFGDWCEADGRVDVASARPGARLDDPSSFSCEVPRGAETADGLAEMKTVVIGPGGRPYLTDGHHTLTSFIETPDGGPNLRLRLKVVANLSTLKERAFWRTMRANKWTYLQRPDGTKVAPQRLPRTLALHRFQDDRYRSLLYFTRDIGYQQTGIPFQEFYWGDWIRDSRPGGLVRWDRTSLSAYLTAVEKATRGMVSLPPDQVISDGFTASQLGALPAWNDGKAADKGEWAKLAKPYSDSKPGKLAYALEYKQRHGLR